MRINKHKNLSIGSPSQTSKTEWWKNLSFQKSLWLRTINLTRVKNRLPEQKINSLKILEAKNKILEKKVQTTISMLLSLQSSNKWQLKPLPTLLPESSPKTTKDSHLRGPGVPVSNSKRLIAQSKHLNRRKTINRNKLTLCKPMLKTTTTVSRSVCQKQSAL